MYLANKHAKSVQFAHFSVIMDYKADTKSADFSSVAKN